MKTEIDIGKERIDKFLDIFTSPKKIDFFTEESHSIYDLSVEKNEIYYRVVEVLECHCCDDWVDKESNLDWYIGFMSENEFNEFIESMK